MRCKKHLGVEALPATPADLHPAQAAAWRAAFEDIAADASKLARHAFAVGREPGCHIQGRVIHADGARIPRQMDGRARHAEADGDLGANRDEFEIFYQGAADETVKFNSALV